MSKFNHLSFAVLKVPCEDVLLVRGGAMSGAQRPRRGSLQTHTLQDLSLLATWRPKTRYTSGSALAKVMV